MAHTCPTGGRHVAQVMDYSLLVGVVKDPAARVRCRTLEYPEAA